MNSTLGKSIARLACSITTTEAVDEVATEKPPDSIDAEVTEASGVSVVVAKLMKRNQQRNQQRKK